MKFIKAPIAIKFDCKRVDAENDLWDVHYEEEVELNSKENVDATKRTMELLSARFKTVKQNGNKISISFKRASRQQVFDMIAGEVLVQSSFADVTFMDILGLAIASTIKNNSDLVSKIFDDKGEFRNECTTKKPSKRRTPLRPLPRTPRGTP